MDIQEVKNLKRELDEEYREDTKAIDRVLALLERRRSSEKIQNFDTSDRNIPISEKSNQEIQIAEIPNGQVKGGNFAFVDTTKTQNSSINGNVGNLNGNKFGRVRDAGVKGIAKQVVVFLPQEFTRKVLLETMEKHFPESSSKFTKDAINGAVKRLLEDNLIRVHQKLGGQSPIIYRKN